MLAVLAALALLIGLIIRIVHTGFDLGDVWFWLLVGLILLAVHESEWTPGRRP